MKRANAKDKKDKTNIKQFKKIKQEIITQEELLKDLIVKLSKNKKNK